MEKHGWDTTLDSKDVHINNVKSLLDIEAKDFNHRVVHAIIKAILKGDTARAQRLLEEKLSIEEKSDNKSANMPKNVVDNIMSITQEYLKEIKANNRPTSVNIGIAEKKSFKENIDTDLVEKEGNYKKKNIKKETETNEKEYEPSDEYKAYTKEKQNLIKSQAEEVLNKIQEKINESSLSEEVLSGEDIEEITHNDDIISEHMTSEGLTKTSAPEENIKIDATNPAPEKEKSVGLSEEDKRIQTAVYNIVSEYKKRLEEKKDKKALADFQLSPYGWVNDATQNAKIKIIRKMEDAKKDTDKAILAETLTNIESDLLDLKKAYEKKLPLALEKNTDMKEITDENLSKIKENLNAYFKNQNDSYKFSGAVQKGNAQYVTLENSTGKKFEIEIRNLNGMIERSKSENKKSNEIINMKKGDIVSVTEKGNRTDFEILDINEGQVSFKNLSNNIRGTMTKENMVKFISSSERIIKIEDKKQEDNTPIIPKSPADEVKPEVKAKDKIDAEYEGSKIFKANWEGKEIPEELKAVADLEKEFGYVNPLMMQRYMKISTEEAQQLFDKYSNKEKSKETEEDKQKEIDALLNEIKALADQEKQIDNNLLSLYEQRKQIEKEENEEKYLGAKKRFGDPTEGKPFNLDVEKEIADINETLKNKEQELKETNIFSRGKVKREIKALIEKRDRFTKNAIDSDKKARPFLYFQTGKIRNPYVLRLLKRFNESYDLRELGKHSNTEDIDGKFKEIKLNYLFKNNAGEGFHEYNSLGFTKIITSGEDKSEDASYKIMSPEGTIIADNIKGYQKATEVYNQARQEYLEKIEKEFNKNN